MQIICRFEKLFTAKALTIYKRTYEISNLDIGRPFANNASKRSMTWASGNAIEAGFGNKKIF